MKLRTQWSQGMIAIIQCRIFCLAVCFPIKKYRIIILPFIWYGMETWSRWGSSVGSEGSREGCWGKYLGLRRTRWKRNGEDYITRSFMVCNHISFGWQNKEEWNWRGMWRVCEIEEVCTWFCWGDLRERKQLEGLSVDENVILKWIFKKLDCNMCTRLIRHRRRTGDGLLWMQ